MSNDLTINLRIHQEDFIETVLQVGAGGRFFLSAPPGAGKTVALAALLERLSSSATEQKRYLIVTPVAMLVEWQNLPIEPQGIKAIAVNAPEYRRLQAATPANVNPWANLSTVVISIDFLKQESRLAELLSLDWEVVIFEEVHLYSDGTLRQHAARALWESPQVNIAIAVSSDDNAPAWLREDSNLRHVRWSYEILRRSDFHWRLDRRRFELIEYHFSESEREFITRLRESIQIVDSQTSSPSLLQRRLESSLFAVEQSLRRFTTIQTKGVADSLDLPEDVELTKQTSTHVDNYPSYPTSVSRHELLELYENIEQDSKWIACEKLIRNIMKFAPLRAIVIFTEFLDTAYYLRSLCLNMEWPTSVINIGTDEEQLSQHIREAGEKFGILIISSVLRLQGFEIGTNQAIHYDLPDDIRFLNIRLTRFLYHGLGEPEWHYFLVNEETKGATNLKLDEIREIERSWTK